jgi:hypothetical protein
MDLVNLKLLSENLIEGDKGTGAFKYTQHDFSG